MKPAEALATSLRSLLSDKAIRPGLNEEADYEGRQGARTRADRQVSCARTQRNKEAVPPYEYKNCACAFKRP